MKYKRSHLIDPKGGTYHVCSRCVRKSFLFGIDSNTGKDVSHRRGWIEQRIVELSGLFSISVYAYSIMSNHYHLILNVEQEELSDDEIVDRWLQLCPGRVALREKEDGFASQRMALLEDPLRLQAIRLRLISVSWFMRFLNEPLARMANREDDCTGRFWEGRFKSQALLDEASILACMVYVDLNPIRAGLTISLDESYFTSIKQRLSAGNFTAPLVTIGQQRGMTSISPINLDTYLELILWTESSSRGRSRGLSSRILQCLKYNHTSVNSWFHDHLPRPRTWQRALGSATNMQVYAISHKQRWIRKRTAIRLHP